MFGSLKMKLIVPSVLVLTALVAVLVVFTAIRMGSFSDELSRERLDTAILTTDSYLDSIWENIRLASIAAATANDIIWRVEQHGAGVNRDGNREALLAHLQTIKPTLGIDSVVIVDSNFDVVLRSHAPNAHGDNVAGVPIFQRGMQGEEVPSFSATDAIPMSISYLMPIVHRGEVIGTLSTNVTMSSSDFVDRFADALNAEITVFNIAGERIATTLTNAQGQREVGTFVADRIIDAVIRNNNRYSGAMELKGRPFSAYYFPLHGWDGSVVGMFFAGFSNEDTVAAVTTMQMTLVVMGVAGLFIAVVLMYIFSSRLIAPIGKLVALVADVSKGRLNTNADKKALPKDEIGALTLDVLALVDVIKGMVNDLSSIQHEYNVKGNMTYRMDATRYENSFREMVESVNAVLEEEVANIKNITSLLASIGNGDFNVKIDELPGDFIMQTNGMRDLTAKLKSVNTEISNIIEAAAVKGDLNYTIDASQFNGSWKKIMAGLGEICAAVNAPILEIMNTIKRMNEGRFDARINGSYAGVFKQIKEDVNFFVKDTDDYMQEINKCMAALAQGDLRAKINMDFVGDYAPVKQSVNNISETLSKTMREISTASNQVLSGAKQISNSATDLANGAQQQASSIEELNASIDVINQQTQQNAASALEASNLSRKSTENANAGNETMNQMLDAMSQIKDSSNEISKIIKNIEDISFQTNLLSLNASVEAARAGEHGRGFAVVADEVRNLANKSQQSTVESTELINQSITRVDAGSSIAETTSESLAIIVKNASEILDIINAISASSKEQAESIAQISQGLAQISGVVQANSAVSEETAAASQELNSQAEVLQQLVSYFKM
ncbi:MAG: methyl-accepting chemotaxis protein [Defluviitaleaceae bacterium]|nr:methyl-accepting chemotaxis protein [Defluviitaleaceae bacterium]MCL2274606.1 methyl-accepting chemotaxis protein [Defluviitaleaceae bacterium]